MEGLTRFVSSFKDGDRAVMERSKDKRNELPERPRQQTTRGAAALPFSIEEILSGTKCGTELGKDQNRRQDMSQPSTSSLLPLVTGKFEVLV